MTAQDEINGAPEFAAAGPSPPDSSFEDHGELASGDEEAPGPQAGSNLPIVDDEIVTAHTPTAVVNKDLTLVTNDEVLAADTDLLDEFSADAEEVDLTHMRIASLKSLGLHRVPKIKVAGFRQNLLTDMKGLEELPTDLEQLDLYDNRLEHMDRRLEQFGPEMTSLDLSFNNFRHIKHLQTMTGLTDLYLCQNAISKIQGLEALTRITNLELGANKIRTIECLDKLVNLEKLWLARNKITKLENLDKLTKLKILSIQSNRITKLEGLDKLVELEELYISHNGLEVIEGLENNLELNTLDVSNNRIKTLTGLDHLENLEELWCSYNQISDFANVEQQLKHLPNFHTIYLEHNPVQYDNRTTYTNKLRLALGPTLRQIDANPVRQG